MSIVAIITARGGSKRIPKKNIRPFFGKPIIAYSIEAAKKSGIFDTVMVSTDSEEIAGIAREYGAEIPFLRSEKTSDDHASTADVLREVLEMYRERGKDFDTFCCLYPTAPFVTGERLKDAYGQMREAGADSLMTLVKYGFPPQRSMAIRDGFAVYRYPQFEKSRSQDLEPVYHDCGQFYFCDTKIFLEKNSLVAGHTYGYQIPEEEVQDIDNESDWTMAELKYRLLNGG